MWSGRKAKNDVVMIKFSSYWTKESTPETDKKSELTSEGLLKSSYNLDILEFKPPL